MDSIPILETPRLRLRGLTADDAPAIQRLAGAKEIADTTLLIPHPYPDGAAEQFIQQSQVDWHERRTAGFAITLRDGEFCGSIGLRIDSAHHHAELGYWIGVPFWGRGYCTEAAGAVLGFGFRNLGLHRICAHHFLRNPASGRVLLKIGMAREGRLREHVRRWDRFEDLECYGILRPEWEAKHSS